MHTLTLKVQDSVLDKVIYFLNHLPKHEVEIIEDKLMQEETKKASERENVFQNTSGMICYKNIDPIVWQRQIRSEWE